MTLAVASAGSKALWFATRGSGTVALLALTATVVLGIAGAKRLESIRLPRFVVAGLHRNLTLIALAVLAVHIGTSVADTYAPVGLKDAMIPFLSAYRPFWLGLGALAFDLLLVLTITSLARRRIGFRRWRLMHWLAYAAWPVALLHALGTGSDPRAGWMRLVALLSLLAVGGAVIVRLGPPTRWRSGQAGVAATALLFLVAASAWYATGPARRGWARRAGTPVALTAPRPGFRRTLASASSDAVAASLPSPPFTARFAGRLRQSPGRPGRVVIDITGRTSRGAVGKLWIRLEGVPIGDGVSMVASGASFGPPTWPSQYVGTISRLEGTRMLLSLRGRRGALDAFVDLSIDQRTGAVSGVVRAEPGPADAQ